MGKIVRLTESDLVRLVKRIINENETLMGGEGGMGPQTKDYDHFGKIITPQMKSAGFKLVDESKAGSLEMCKFYNGNCCKYFVYGSHEAGVNLFLECGDGAWKYVVYYKGNKGIKNFPLGGTESNSKIAAQKAIDYALSLKNYITQ